MSNFYKLQNHKFIYNSDDDKINHLIRNDIKLSQNNESLQTFLFVQNKEDYRFVENLDYTVITAQMLLNNFDSIIFQPIPIDIECEQPEIYDTLFTLFSIIHGYCTPIEAQYIYKALNIMLSYNKKCTFNDLLFYLSMYINNDNISLFNDICLFHKKLATIISTDNLHIKNKLIVIDLTDCMEEIYDSCFLIALKFVKNMMYSNYKQLLKTHIIITDINRKSPKLIEYLQHFLRRMRSHGCSISIYSNDFSVIQSKYFVPILNNVNEILCFPSNTKEMNYLNNLKLI